MYTPENVTDTLEVWAPECTSKQLLEAFKEFSAAQPFSLVTFRSRPGKEGQETLNLKAWWLPAPGDDGSTPRIIVQHGNNVDFNDNTVMLTAYLLRSIGFSVLLPNHRHHGIHRVGQRIRWGYDLFLDVLGAWDFAVEDPEGLLGGPLDKRKVGVMGISMGGLAAFTAFGYEPDIPAAWIDAGVYDLQDELSFQISAALPLGPADPALALAKWLGWRFASFFAGADIGLYDPRAMVAKGASSNLRPRAVQVVQGLNDSMVPPRQSHALVEALRAHGGAYNVSTLFKMYSCGGEQFPFPTHVQMHTWRPNLYRSELCRFWSSAFELSAKRCELSSLPRFPECAEAVCPQSSDTAEPKAKGPSFGGFRK